MKNLLIFVGKTKDFDRDFGILAKIQIDNSLDLGWKREDIILVTNFEFEYKGVKSFVVSDSNYVSYSPTNSKIKAILELFNKGIIQDDELYWFHDLDATQTEVISEHEIVLGEADMALTSCEWRDRWSTGVLYFISNAKDIFEAIDKTADLLLIQEEVALMLLANKFTDEEKKRLKNSYSDETLKKVPNIKDVEKRIRKINTSYNFIPYAKTKYCYDLAIKPIKVVHFHLNKGFPRWGIPSLKDFYMYGKNDINTVFMPERIIKIYNHHGIR